MPWPGEDALNGLSRSVLAIIKAACAQGSGFSLTLSGRDGARRVSRKGRTMLRHGRKSSLQDPKLPDEIAQANRIPSRWTRRSTFRQQGLSAHCHLGQKFLGFLCLREFGVDREGLLQARPGLFLLAQRGKRKP